jgi:GMP synthase (glutamine-hydrolysing)
MIKEITARELNIDDFINEKIKEIKETVGDGIAINALSGGVDSSTVTMLGHRALGNRLKTAFIDNGIMREGEAGQVVGLFRNLGVKVEVIDARKEFFSAFKGITDPEEKREAITQTFYKKVFGDLVKASGAKFLLQGTNWTDVEETVAGVKRQHNILEQLGIDTQKVFGYKVLEPVLQLRKTSIRVVGKALGLPEEIYQRPPFPGPALAARVIGEVTPERVALVRAATVIVEEEVAPLKPFQAFAVLLADKGTGIVDGKRTFGNIIIIRSVESKDAMTAEPTPVPFDILTRMAKRITKEIPDVSRVAYELTPKPPATIEYI